MVVLVLLTACSNESQTVSQGEELAFLEVELTISPASSQPNETILFEAAVSYGDKPVTDADEVKYEIWRANDSEHEQILVEHEADGIYKLEKAFTEEGTYYVYAHVTAKDMHAMPKKEFVIGQPSEPETESSSTEMD